VRQLRIESVVPAWQKPAARWLSDAAIWAMPPAIHHAWSAHCASHVCVACILLKTVCCVERRPTVSEAVDGALAAATGDPAVDALKGVARGVAVVLKHIQHDLELVWGQRNDSRSPQGRSCPHMKHCRAAQSWLAEQAEW
jgi:hypothetical protein